MNFYAKIVKLLKLRKEYPFLFILTALFAALFMLVFLNEALDLPYFLFGGKSKSANWAGILIEQTFLFAAFLISFSLAFRKHRAELKLKEELNESLKLRDLLLKEIHHRIKNNLSIISSIINLEKNEFDEPQFKNSLDKIRSRITSIAIVHELICEKGVVGKINFKTTGGELLRNIFNSCSFSGNYSFDSEDVFIDHNESMFLSLILNEIVINAIKHGYKNQSDFTLRISFQMDKDYKKLVISNNGPPLERSKFESESNRSLGNMIIKSFVSKLGGKIKVSDSPLTSFEILYPAN